MEGLATVCGAGDPKTRHGIAIHIYACNKSMKDRYKFRFFNFNCMYKSKVIVYKISIIDFIKDLIT